MTRVIRTNIVDHLATHHHLTTRATTTSADAAAPYHRLSSVASNVGTPSPQSVGRMRLGMTTSSTRACTVRWVGGRPGMMDRNIR